MLCQDLTICWEGVTLMWKPFFFFFSSRRRHTRFDCDWSSDVCSSDLRLFLWRPICMERGHRFCWCLRRGVGRGAWGEEGRFRGGAGFLKKKKKNKAIVRQIQRTN